MMKRRLAAWLSAFALVPPALLAAEGERRSLAALRVSTPPVIDGDVGDEVWKKAAEITGFTQIDPEEGKPATQQTRVRVVYDDQAVYFSLVMEDSGKVTPLLARRDTELNNGDYVRISIDSQHDRLSGAAFVVNPSNVQMDLALHNDIYSDTSWDAVWGSAAKITAGGWSAEVRIPYSQLRFPAKEQHTWGFNVSRWNARLREASRLVFTPKNESAFVSRFADLTGINGIRPRRGFEVVPYAVGRTDLHSKFDNPFIAPSAHRIDAGVDIKYGITSSLTLTGTINPDFGQVEVDPAVVNLSQFETFFPEKRPFFTEGASVFQFGNGPASGRWGFNMRFPTFFYSRRIGRAPQGFVNPAYIDSPEAADGIDYSRAPGETTILGAAKVTGKIGKKWTIGVLDAVTDREQAWYRAGSLVGRQTVEPMTNYFVGRAMREYGKDSRVGFMFTSVNRRLAQSLEPTLRESAYFGGIDGYTLFKEKAWLLEWLGGSTLVEGSEAAIAATQRNSARYYQRPDARHVDYDPTRTSLGGWVARTTLSKQKGKWRPNLQVQAVSPGYEGNDVGFMPRVDSVSTHALLQYVDTDLRKRTRERGFWVSKFQNWNFDGDMTTNGLSGVGWMNLLNYWSVEAWSGLRADAIDDQRTRGGPAVIGPGSRYVGTGFGSDSRKPLSFRLWTEKVSADDGGSSDWGGFTLTYRPSPAVRLSLSPTYGVSKTTTQYVSRVADASYTPTYGQRYIFATLDQKQLDIGIRADWTVSARLSLQLYMQPFVGSGSYHSFKQLTRARDDEYMPLATTYDASRRRYSVAAEPSIAIVDPNFNFRSVRGSAVARWEFRPGSALYVVWNENRAEQMPFGDFRPRRDFAEIARAPSRDVFLVKLSYWLPI